MSGNLRVLVQDLENDVRDLESAARSFQKEYEEQFGDILSIVDQISKSWSRSWLGYQAEIYYHDFRAIPPNVHFSKDWGLERSNGDWMSCEYEDMLNYIKAQAKNNKVLEKIVSTKSKELKNLFLDKQHNFLSLISVVNIESSNDTYLNELIEQARKLESYDQHFLVRAYYPQGTMHTRDARVSELTCPPHIKVLCYVQERMSSCSACLELAKILTKIISHIKIKMKLSENEQTETKLSHSNSEKQTFALGNVQNVINVHQQQQQSMDINIVIEEAISKLSPEVIEQIRKIIKEGKEGKETKEKIMNVLETLGIGVISSSLSSLLMRCFENM